MSHLQEQRLCGAMPIHQTPNQTYGEKHRGARGLKKRSSESQPRIPLTAEPRPPAPVRAVPAAYSAGTAGARRAIHSNQRSNPVFDVLDTRTMSMSGCILRAFASATCT